MFIAAGSDFSDGEVRDGGTQMRELSVETRTAARMGGGGRGKYEWLDYTLHCNGLKPTKYVSS